MADLDGLSGGEVELSEGGLGCKGIDTRCQPPSQTGEGQERRKTLSPFLQYGQ